MGISLRGTRGEASRPFESPSFPGPELTKASDLESIGTDRSGREWFTHKRHPGWGEFAERRQLVDLNTTDQELPNGPVVEIEPNIFRTFDSPRPPGTFARLVGPKNRRATPVPPVRPIDAFGLLALAAERPERVAGGLRAVHVRAAEPPARGVDRLIARLASAGATVALSADAKNLVISSAGGQPAYGVLELVKEAGPLILASLQGQPLHCTVTKHAKPIPAVTIALGGAPWCGECRTEWHELAAQAS